VLLKKARRNGLRECIHSACGRRGYQADDGKDCVCRALQEASCMGGFKQHMMRGC